MDESGEDTLCERHRLVVSVHVPRVDDRHPVVLERGGIAVCVHVDMELPASVAVGFVAVLTLADEGPGISVDFRVDPCFDHGVSFHSDSMRLVAPVVKDYFRLLGKRI